MGRLILTTVGTSLFRVLGPPPLDGDRRLPGQACQAAQDKGLAPWDVLTRAPAAGEPGDLDRAEAILLEACRPKAEAGELRSISAETASLSQLGPGPEDRIVLVASDTVHCVVVGACLAMLCCEQPRILRLSQQLAPTEQPADSAHLRGRRRALAGRLAAPPIFQAAVDVMMVEGLTWAPRDQPDQAARDFRLRGCHNLAATVSALIRYRDPRQHPTVICNITGGLKSSIPFISWVASLYGGVELAYLYEDSPALLRATVPHLEVPPEVRDFIRGQPRDWPDVHRAGARAYYEDEQGRPVLSLFGQALRAAEQVRAGWEQYRRDAARLAPESTW